MPAQNCWSLRWYWLSFSSRITLDRCGGLTRRSPGFSDMLDNDRLRRTSPMSRVSDVRFRLRVCAPGWNR
ncbi:hypothetical protein D3C72_1596480 [compost metagenome]